jgi:predicted amidohydrolase YtcJ
VSLLIQGVVLDRVWPPPPKGNPGRTNTVDLRIVGDRIAEIAPRLRGRSDDDVVDGRGGPVLPGLHDHHVHLRAWAAAASSVQAGPPAVRSATDLGRRLQAAPGGAGSWVRAVGYHESVAGDLDRTGLDRLVADRPLRVQHRSGALWILNSRALEALGLDTGGPPPASVSAKERIDRGRGDAVPPARATARTEPGPLPRGVETDAAGRATGRVWRADRWLHERLAGLGAAPALDLGPISRRAAAAGVTGFTDATPDHDDDGAALVEAQRNGSLLQRLHLMTGAHSALDRDLPGGSSAPVGTGSRAEPRRWTDESGALVTEGPVKLLLDDARLPDFDDLVSAFRDAHRRGRPVAVHCVTRTQAVLTASALGEAGPIAGDRMEHGAVLGSDLLPVLRGLGVTVVTQPGFVLERGDRYLADIDRDDRRDRWRLASLLDAGIPVALSTDAPFGPEDPWTTVAAAASRRTAEGRSLGPNERIAARRAVALFLGRPEHPTLLRTVTPGAVADLTILANPLDEGLASGSPAVVATVVAGAVVHLAEER